MRTAAVGLVLESSAASVECEPGSTVRLEAPRTWGTYVEAVPATQAMTLSALSRSGCEALDELEGTWIRVS